MRTSEKQQKNKNSGVEVLKIARIQLFRTDFPQDKTDPPKNCAVITFRIGHFGDPPRGGVKMLVFWDPIFRIPPKFPGGGPFCPGGARFVPEHIQAVLAALCPSYDGHV